MKKVVIISVCIVCLLTAGLAVAGGYGWHHSPEKKIERLKSKLTEKLDLDDSQKETLDRITTDMLDEHAEFSGSREEFKANLVGILEQERVNSEDLKALFETKKPVMEKMMTMAADHISEFHSILTPEQRAKLVAEIKSHKKSGCRFMR